MATVCLPETQQVVLQTVVVVVIVVVEPQDLKLRYLQKRLFYRGMSAACLLFLGTVVVVADVAVHAVVVVFVDLQIVF